MLTLDQLKWINHLRDDDKIKIIPFDSTADQKFALVMDQIKKALGEDIQAEHRGATSLGISGQDEIDVYLPVPGNKFESLLLPLSKLLGCGYH
jgi:GrpB-like predicted nucleotidyltransferase (UPF0157 family)